MNNQTAITAMVSIDDSNTVNNIKNLSKLVTELRKRIVFVLFIETKFFHSLELKLIEESMYTFFIYFFYRH